MNGIDSISMQFKASARDHKDVIITGVQVARTTSAHHIPINAILSGSFSCCANASVNEMLDFSYTFSDIRIFCFKTL